MYKPKEVKRDVQWQKVVLYEVILYEFILLYTSLLRV